MDRRAILAGAGVGLSVRIAGCLQRVTELADNNNRDSMYELVQFSAPVGSADWAGHDDPSGHVELYGSSAVAFDRLDFDEVREARRDAVEAFVEATAFDPEALLYVASKGPSSLYAEIDVEELAVEDGRITGTVRATEVGSGGGDGAVTYPSALVRLTDVSEQPERAESTIIDGWGDETVKSAEIRR